MISSSVRALMLMPPVNSLILISSHTNARFPLVKNAVSHPRLVYFAMNVKLTPCMDMGTNPYYAASKVVSGESKETAFPVTGIYGTT